MNAYEIRNSFLDFFRSKEHAIVPSAPIVVKNDPTLMFTNAGMNQFKDIFLGNQPSKWKRAADSQKCLRVSGKHNDLEEVGHDTRRHFCESAARFHFEGWLPRKMSLNWFMPALVNISVGSFLTTMGADGTMVCSLERKKSKKLFLIS